MGKFDRAKRLLHRSTSKISLKGAKVRILGLGEVEFEVSDRERVTAHHIITEIENRRALYDPIAKEDVNKMLRSLHELRGIITESIKGLPHSSRSEGRLAWLLQRINWEIGRFLTTWENEWAAFITRQHRSYPEDLYHQISEFRNFPNNMALENDLLTMRITIVDYLAAIAELVQVEFDSKGFMPIYLTNGTTPRKPPVSIPKRVQPRPKHPDEENT